MDGQLSSADASEAVGIYNPELATVNFKPIYNPYSAYSDGVEGGFASPHAN